MPKKEKPQFFKCDPCHHLHVPGYGAGSARLMIVAEAPAAEEEIEGRPLVGPSGRLLDKLLQECGISRNECYATNVVKIRVPDTKTKETFQSRLFKMGHSVDDFRSELDEEIYSIKPNCILALGNIALQGLTGNSGITHYRGSILQSKRYGCKVVSTFHPANVFKTSGEGGGVFKYSALAYMKLDIKRAIEESETPELDLPQRWLQIARSYRDVYDFFNRYKDHKRAAIDIEVIRSIPVCIGIAFSSSHGISIPLINLPESGDYRIPEYDLVEIWDLVARFLEDESIEKIGQNIKFDQRSIEEILRIHIANVYADTMLMQLVAYPEMPKKLEFLCSIYTREPYYKHEGKEFNVKKDTMDKLFLYNCKDACVTYEVFEKLEEELREMDMLQWYYEYQHPLHQFYIDMEREGLPVDETVRTELKVKYAKLLCERQSELEKLLGYDLNVQSPQQVAHCLYVDLGLPLRGQVDEDTLVGLIGNHATDDRKRRVLDLILEIRRIRKTRGTYLNRRPDYDGRMRCSYRIAGTETGRTSTSVLDPPIRPYKGEIGLAFQTMTKHGDVGADLRRMFIAG